jgi:serine/threonine-protein kinase
MNVPPSGSARVCAPRLVGRYAVYDEIAHGGLGTVHLALLVGPSGFARVVAANLPHPEYADDPVFASMFLDEAKLAARIRHPNVVPTLDVVCAKGQLAVIMEYVDGEALRPLFAATVAERRRMPPATACAIVIDVLHGLHAAHEATDERGEPLGIVHRDVSPQYILVGVDGVTRLIDFGIAKAAGRLQPSTWVGSGIKGKFAYLAPEQVRGDPVDRRTDVYAAGIVLWELLTGERLFRGRTCAAVLEASLELRIPLPSEFAPDLSPRLDAIVSKALSRDPARRHSTAHEMARELEACFAPLRASAIGAWVQEMAGHMLAHRAAILSRVERRSNVPEPDGPAPSPSVPARAGPDEVTALDGAQAPSSGSTFDDPSR